MLIIFHVHGYSLGREVVVIRPHMLIDKLGVWYHHGKGIW